MGKILLIISAGFIREITYMVNNRADYYIFFIQSRIGEFTNILLIPLH